MQRIEEVRRADDIKATTADAVAAREKEMSPGRIFAEACAMTGPGTCVEYDVTITGSVGSSRRKRRPVRHLLTIVHLSRDPRRYYWHESLPEPGDAKVNDAELRREAAS